MAERGSGKILSVTFKRAKRVQEKMMQKLGKSDQTKDEVFEEFVNNFNKQNFAALKLQKELTKYMNALRVLSQCTKSLSDILHELYEQGWEGYNTYRDKTEARNLLWEDLLTSLQSKMVEPMSNYISRFPEVKNRIQKRERKCVDFDMTRREMETIRSKQKVTDQKIQQAEESYTHAKQLYDEITDELYEELPTFYDSRIQFYASVFQSIAATEARFHAEIAKVEEQFASIMDALAEEAATGIHSTKKERTLDTSPRVLSRPGEDSSESSDTESHPSVSQTSPIPNSPKATPSEMVSMPTSDEVPVSPDSVPEDGPSEQTNSQEETTLPSPVTSPTRISTGPQVQRVESTSKRPPKPSRSSVEEAKTSQDSEEEGSPSSPMHEEVFVPQKESEEAETKLVPSSEESELPSCDDKTVQSSKSPDNKLPPPKPNPLEQVEGNEVKKTENILFKVQATHPYVGDDEDELTFEKGAVICVIPYEDAEDEEEGWLMGVIEGTDMKGIFPENFTKRLQ